MFKNGWCITALNVHYPSKFQCVFLFFISLYQTQSPAKSLVSDLFSHSMSVEMGADVHVQANTTSYLFDLFFSLCGALNIGLLIIIVIAVNMYYLIKGSVLGSDTGHEDPQGSASGTVLPR